MAQQKVTETAGRLKEKAHNIVKFPSASQPTQPKVNPAHLDPQEDYRRFRGKPLSAVEIAELRRKFEAILKWKNYATSRIHPRTGPRELMIVDVNDTYEDYLQHYRYDEMDGDDDADDETPERDRRLALIRGLKALGSSVE